MRKLVPPYDYDTLRTFEECMEANGFHYLNSGSFRDAYARKGVVVKVPSNTEGLRHNIFEAYIYRKFRKTPTSKGALFAPCRLLGNGCLMMVTVEFYPEGKPKPEWSDWIDHEQVGFYNGRWVAYDFGIDIGEDLEVEASNWADIQGQPFDLDAYHDELEGVIFRDAIGSTHSRTGTE